MTTTIVEGPAIVIGYQYRLQIETDAALFPQGCEVLGHVRKRASDAQPIASLSSQAGTVLILGDKLIELIIPPAQTAAMAPGTIVLDVVRTDASPARHLGFVIEVPVVLPVTRGL